MGLIIAPVVHACTAFLVANDSEVLSGNNLGLLESVHH
jgi:hypothetical protein